MADKITTMGNTIVSETPEAVAERAAADFAVHVNRAVAERTRCSVALPGGSTPKHFFSRLALPPYAAGIPWNKVWFFWGDERCVPPTHPESNFKLAKELLLDKVPVMNSHVFRMRGEDPPAEAARAYSKLMHDALNSEPWPEIDIMILGIGTDGHTASLMPGTAALQEERRWVVENVVRSLSTVRITMSLPVINHSKNIWFLVTGPKKAAAYAKAQSGSNPEWPASLVRPVNGQLTWYIDKAVVEAK